MIKQSTKQTHCTRVVRFFGWVVEHLNKLTLTQTIIGHTRCESRDVLKHESRSHHMESSLAAKKFVLLCWILPVKVKGIIIITNVWPR
jgi:hypothetical protein